MEIEVKKSKRIQPTTIICPSTRHRIINQIIYEEFILSVWNRYTNWTSRAQNRLLGYNIELSRDILKTYKRQIKRGERDPISLPNFKSVMGGELSSRYGKDNMYNQFDIWQKCYLQKPARYVGLPANQILQVRRKYELGNIFPCEINKTMAKFMWDLQLHFAESPRIKIINQNIFKYLKETLNSFSVYDFDLMCQIDSFKVIEDIVNGIIRTAQERVVVNVVTTIGRWITEKEYKEIIPLVSQMLSKDFIVLNTYSGGYNDKIIPMRFEFLALERR